MPDLPISATTTPRTQTRVGEDHNRSAATDSTALIADIAYDLDLNTVDMFRAMFGALVDRTASGLADGDLIVLDLSRVDFMSVQAVPALIEARDLASRLGIDFKLITATRGVEHALTATGARQIFECHATIESACTADAPRVCALTDTAGP
ncbi:anti-anti-sigma factor [Rhodococcus sp. OK519]|uniref:STAS domain-containing protein n=1 Tax=Rhodococcus sp. OK519 TaxID=2135729 RepID=UPI000D450557|nr:anti-anti-sigma factor [Rhodococcus sp. OK519]